MGFNEGDFLRIEYTTWRAADNSLVYTTDKEVAKKNDAFDEKARYKPELVIVGKGTVIPGIEKELRGMSLNQSKKLELEPKDAFGERSQDAVRVMPLSDFRAREINPYPGMRLDIDGVPVTIKSVNGGRVLVDANHPLAGEKLVCEVKVIAKIDGDKEKVTTFAENYDIPADSVAIEGGVARISFGQKVKKDADYFIHKDVMVAAILKHLPNVSKVVISEEYVREEKEGKKDTEQTAAEK